MPDLRIGISGWTYPPWRGVFYPKKLAQKKELEFASRRFNSIEVNGSFYSMQTPSSFQMWFDRTPDDFVFAVKGSRYITHMLKLKNVQTALANFFASGPLRLQHKLGPILWQFPKQMPVLLERFEAFLKMLPRDFKEAAKIARKHDDRLKAPASMRVKVNHRIRHAFELRREELFSPEFVRLLREHDAALVFADTAGKFPYAEDVTSDFIYIRLHGSKQLYVSGYEDGELKRWARRVRSWQKGNQPADAALIDPRAMPAARKSRDVYVYFDNDAKVHAPFNAKKLAQILNIALEPSA